MNDFRALSCKRLGACLLLLSPGCGFDNNSSGTPWLGARPDAGSDAGSMPGNGTPNVDGGATTGNDASPVDAAAPNDASSPSMQDAAAPNDGEAPIGFWDTTNIPAAKNVMIFKFLNRTNGKFTDAQVFWSFKSGAISETHSIAEMPTYDMPANSSGRMYFYLCGTNAPANCAGDQSSTAYYDFIEHTIGPAQYNGNTTRVDAFGIKIAMRLHCADGYDTAVGEDYATFLEDRAVTFRKFVSEVPAEYQALAQPPFAPYRIVEPGSGEFKPGGMYATYYDDFVNQLWTANGLAIAKPGPNGSGLGAYPDVSAAIMRHVGDKPGTFSAGGQLLDHALWASSATFYQAAPANYYAKFWHTHGLNGKAYGFPYDDVGGYSSFLSHGNPQYMLVAIGW